MQQTTLINNFLAGSSFFYTITVDMDGRYAYVSPNYDKNFDFLGDSLLGKEFSLTLHPDDIKVCAEVGGQCFQHPDKLFPATLRKHDGKGGYVITQWELKAIFDQNGQPVGIFCIGYNITEHMDTKSRLEEIGYMQSHLVRRPLANIIGLAGIISGMETSENLQNINALLLDSARQLDEVVRSISDKS